MTEHVQEFPTLETRPEGGRLKGLLPDVVGTAPLPAVFIADDAGGTPKVAEYVGPTLDLFLTATVGASTGTFTCGITVALELWDA